MSDTPTDLDSPTIHEQADGPTPADIIRDADVGDRLHVQFPDRDGDVDWRSYWVQDAGDDYVEVGKYRLVVDEDAFKDIALKVQLVDEWQSDDYTPSTGTVERIPAEVFDTIQIYEWEVHVSETQMGGVSTDQTVFPEAPSKTAAEAKAKRWAELDSGYTPVTYREQEVTPP